MLELFGHRFSSYTQKALIALYENELPFTWRQLGPEHPEHGAELKRLWPIAKFPLLRDDGAIVVEATAIIEHLAVHHPGPVALVPADPGAAVRVRMLDRVFDNYVMAPMMRIVADALRPVEARDPTGTAEAERMLDTVYGWLDGEIAQEGWIAGDFSLADCAAAPSLFYADWIRPIPETHPRLRAYRARLLARPSFARAVEEARAYRHLFPLGAPDRD